MIVEGVPREGGERIILAAEISTTINLEDIGRANDRAAILSRAGYKARGLVGGRRVTPEARRLADQLDVIVGIRVAAGASLGSVSACRDAMGRLRYDPSHGLFA